ncbi:3-isopropylmalate dehydratase, small subunit [Caballeronia fortuita]|uniref:3-isopropylmalate dehydratase small subunit n=1 Tax=Caballeronia fortuita TaxID=1777138 RepID=A0A158CU22_9BURK|nr:3-isopropylmalate dehydratase small subunit [Caballeronia fortuita]SAK85814.1 3-isopropylmalate dehydratase, small subunit [Caballeronia fortuita]
MTRLINIRGTALPLPIENLDTDQIMPKQFLRITDKTGLAKGFLHDLRFDAYGMPRGDSILNSEAYANARILIGGSNFGCGSSREHAVWGMQQYGFQAVIAPSFAEIFYSNAMNNRLLLVQLDREEICELTQFVLQNPSSELQIDLLLQTVRTSARRSFSYEIDARHKQMVVEGLDAIDLTLGLAAQISEFEAQHHKRYPWARVLSQRVLAHETSRD